MRRAEELRAALKPRVSSAARKSSLEPYDELGECSHASWGGGSEGVNATIVLSP